MFEELPCPKFAWRVVGGFDGDGRLRQPQEGDNREQARHGGLSYQRSLSVAVELSTLSHSYSRT